MRKKVRQWITLILAMVMIVGAVNNDYLITLATNADGTAGTEAVSGNEAGAQDVSGNAAGEQADVSGNAGQQLAAYSEENAAGTPAVYTTGSATEITYTANELGTPSVASNATAVRQKSYEMTFEKLYQDVWFSFPKDDSAKYSIADVATVTFNFSSQVGPLNFFLFDSSKGEDSSTHGKVANFWGKSGQLSYEVQMPADNTESFDGIGIQVAGDSVAQGASAVFKGVKITKKDGASVTYTANELGTYRMWAKSCTPLYGSYELTYSGMWQDVSFSLAKSYNVEEIESITFNVSSQVGSLNFFLTSGGKKIGNYYGKSGKTSYEFKMAETYEKLSEGSFDGIGIQASDDGKAIVEGASAVFDSVVIKLKTAASTDNETPAGDGKDDKRILFSTDYVTNSYNNDGVTATAKDGGRYELALPGGDNRASAFFTLNEELSLKDCTKVTFAVTGQTGAIDFRLYDKDGKTILQQWAKDSNAKECTTTENGTLYYTFDVTEEMKSQTVAKIGISSGAAVSCVIQGVLFEMESGSTPASTDNETPAGDGKDDVRIVLSDDNIKEVKLQGATTATAKENDRYEVSLDAGYKSAVFTLKEEIDLKNCTEVVFAVSELQGNVNLLLYDNTWWSDTCEILGGYGKNASSEECKTAAYPRTSNGTTFYVFKLTDAQRARKVAHIGLSSEESGTSCVLQGVLFVMGEESPDPAPVTENKTKAVEEGYTGIALPALKSNMNSYYKSDKVTYVSDITNGIHTVTYPEDWSQIQFTLSNSVDLTQYDRVTFTVEDATEAVKFGLHYWSEETNTINLWTATAEPDASGYYTFDLDQSALTSGTTATTISVWSNGKAQTLKFHGVTFEKKSGSTPVSTDNETPAGDGKDDVRIVLSDDKIKEVKLQGATTATAKENDRYEVSLDAGYKSAVFTLKEEIDLKNCTEVVFAVSELQGNVNLLLYDNTWWSDTCEILGGYKKNASSEECKTAAYPRTSNGTTFYVFKLTDAQRARKVAHIGLSSEESGTSCVLQGVLFVMGEESPDPAPVTENKTKAVDEGYTGIALPALKSNMNSYYKSDKVTYVSDITNGIHTVTYPEGWNQIQFTLSNSVDLTQYDRVTFTVEDATEAVKFGLHYWSEETNTIDLWNVTAEADASGYYTFDLDQSALTSGTTATTISVWSNGKAQTLKFHGVTFEKKSGSTPVSTDNETPAGDGKDDVRIVLSDDKIKEVKLQGATTATAKENDRYEVSLDAGYKSAVFTLKEEIDLKNCTEVVFAVSELQGNVNLLLYDNTWWSDTCEILGGYGKNASSEECKTAAYPRTSNGTTFYVFKLTDAQRARKVAHIGLSSEESGTSCVLQGVLFVMGEESPVTPDPTPVTENKTKAVDAGNTGIALPALKSNMNSYYRSTNVTYEGNATTGIQTITYPDGWNQIQFTLTNAVDLTKYNKITFTVEDASKPVKFGLHYWSEETNTIDLWTATAEPDAGGYYTFDLNPATLTSGTTATTISIWSNGSAQTLKFHGVTFENEPDKKFESTYEVTYTADQLTTSSGSAVYQNGAWVVAFANKDQDVTFDIPDVLNMAKCLGMTLNFSTVNGPVNFYVSKDGNKAESYWNIHSGTGAVQGSSITCGTLINQIGVQAGRENDEFVPGTTITLNSITFLMSGTRLDRPVNNDSDTSCSAGCFDFDGATKDDGVEVEPILSEDGSKVIKQEITFKHGGTSLTLEIPDSVDVKYLKQISLQYEDKKYVSRRSVVREYGVTISLLDSGLREIAQADSNNIISLGRYFTGAKYIRFTSVGPTVMTLTGVVFTTELPIVLNGNFEDGDVTMWGSALWGDDTGKKATITAEQSSENIVGGVSSYGRIYDRVSPYNCFAQDVTARVTKGKIYKFSFWAKLSDAYANAAAGEREVTFGPYWVDETGKEQYGMIPGGVYKQNLTAGEWTYFEGTVQIPTNAEKFVIRILEQGTNYGQGSCIKGEYYVTGIQMWETDKMDARRDSYGGGGGGSSNKRTITKTATCEVSYNPADLTVNWASATTETVDNGVRISFKNNYDEARLKLTQKLDMSKCAYVKVYVADQSVPIAVKLYKSGVQVDVDYYNTIEGSYVLVPTYGGFIDAIGIMSLATPNPEGARVTVTGITFGMTEEPAPYVPSKDIVLNGDFADEDLSDWQAAFWDQNKGVSITRETSSTPIYGNVYTYATYSRRTSPYQCFAQDITERVEQNETYTFSFWAKLSNDYKGAPSSQRVVQFAPYTVDKNGVANYNPRLDGTYSLILEPGVWTYFEGTYKVTNENPISQVVIRILEQGTDYGKGDCVKGSYSIAGVKMEKFIPEPPSIDEDVPNLSEELCKTFGDDFITGTALGIGEVDDLGIEMLINKHFNAITIGNEMKPDALFGYSNSQHTALQTIEFNGQSLVVPTLNYSKAEEILDKVLKWNAENPDKQIKVRGHVLVWHSQTPEWFFREDYKVGKNADGTENYVSPEVMNQRLEWYIKTVLEHFLGEDSPYKDLFYGWDVVNEAVADGSKGYRTNQVSAAEQPADDTHGSNSSWWAVYQSNEFIIKAFQYANKYAPADIELYYNDYNETDSGKVKGIVTLLKDVLAADGTRIDAMGMQGHYNLSYPALSDIEKAIRAYAEVVGKIQYTELDLKAGRDISNERELQNEYKAQAKRYHDIYQLLKKLDAEDGIEVGGITFWGVVDKYSWLQTASNVGGGSDGSLTQCPLLFDSDYKVKPAYWAFVDYSKVDPEYQEETEETVTEEPSEEKPEETPEPEPETSEQIPVDGDAAEIVEKGGLNVAAVIGICIAAVAVVAGGAAFVVRSRKKKAPTGDSEIK